MKFTYLLCAQFIFLMIFSCDESLPPRIIPSKTLKIVEMYAIQEATAFGSSVLFLIIGENIYEDTFQDTVNVNGTIHIWWKRKPEIEASVKISNIHFVAPTPIEGNVLTLNPNERFHLKINWYLDTDAGKNILDLLTYPSDLTEGGIMNALPEVFCYTTQLKIFDQTGIIHSNQSEFVFKGWKIVTEPNLR